MRPHESLHRPDIKDVGPIIEEAGAAEFDIRQEITETEWAKFEDFLDFIRTEPGHNRGYMCARLAADMVAIDPERARALITPEDRAEMLKALKHVRASSWVPGSPYHWIDVALHASNMATIDPEMIKDEISDHDWDSFKTELRGSRITLSRYLTMAGAMNTINAQRTAAIMTPNDWEWLDDKLSGPNMPIDPVQRVFRFEAICAHLGALDPKRLEDLYGKDELKISLAKLHASLPDKDEIDPMLEFADLAAHLARLSRMLYGAPHDEPSFQPLPEVRTF